MNIAGIEQTADEAAAAFEKGWAIVYPILQVAATEEGPAALALAGIVNEAALRVPEVLKAIEAAFPSAAPSAPAAP